MSSSLRKGKDCFFCGGWGICLLWPFCRAVSERVVADGGDWRWDGVEGLPGVSLAWQLLAVVGGGGSRWLCWLGCHWRRSMTVAGASAIWAVDNIVARV
ncbi:unnamed protein product [Ilex paraguariensis]|uniref:Uncharacterized protein n=1 Tax=Ilex paraguariensis TaxID=185542 RepID=A0ABC8RFX5_9AQUA